MEDTIKIELLTPLTGNFTSRELERQWEEGEYEFDVYEGLPLEGADLSQYESAIKEAIEKYNAIGNEEGKPCNLMDYFDGSAAVKEKVISAVPSVKQKDGVLYGCTNTDNTGDAPSASDASSASDAKAVKTGDAAAPIGWIAVGFAAMLAAVCGFFGRRKRH